MKEENETSDVGEELDTLLGKQIVHTDEVTRAKYYLTKVRTKRMRGSEFNPRKPKDPHIKEILEDMRAHGQYTPVTCMEDIEREIIEDEEMCGLPRIFDPGKDGKDITKRIADIAVADGNHRLIAGLRLPLEYLDAKIYLPDTLPDREKQRMAEYLNLGIKKINPGEEYYATNQRYKLVLDELKSQDAKVINEARIGALARITSKGEKRKFIVGRHVFQLQRENKSPIAGMISDGQTPRRLIDKGDGHLLTAKNVATFLDPLCYVDLIGPWDVIAENTDPEYEEKLFNNEIIAEPNYRNSEYENAKILLEILAEELIIPWLGTNNFDAAVTFCRHHVLKATAKCVKQIFSMPEFVLTSGKNIPLTSPLYFDNKTVEVDWDLLRNHIRKLKNINWNDPLYKERVPDIIANDLWAHMTSGPSIT